MLVGAGVVRSDSLSREDAMESKEPSRRDFLYDASAGATAFAAGGPISLLPEGARATPKNEAGMLPDYDRYDAIGLAELVRGRHLTAGELLDAAVERVEQQNPVINAVVNRMYDHARRRSPRDYRRGRSPAPISLRISPSITPAWSPRSALNSFATPSPTMTARSSRE